MVKLKSIHLSVKFASRPGILFSILTFTLCPVTPALQAKPTPIKISNHSDGITIGRFLEYLEERKTPLEFKHIQNLPDSRWKKQKRDRIFAGTDKKPHWFRFRVESSNKNEKDYAEKPRTVLSFLGPTIDHIELYFPDAKGGYVKKVTGNNHPFDTRDLQDRYLSFRIPLTANKNYYFRLDNNIAYTGSIVSVFGLDAYYSFVLKETISLGLYFGFLGVMCFYNLFIFISVREITFLNYSCFIFSNLLFAIVLEGIGFQFIYSDFPGLQIILLLILGPVTMSLALVFSSQYLNLRNNFPRAHTLLRALALFHLVQIPLFLFVPAHLNSQTPHAYSGFLLGLFSGFSIIVLLCLGVYLAWQGDRAAKFYLLAWGMFICGAAIRILANVQIIPKTFFSNWSLQIGGAMEVTLLSFGLADRINTLKNHLSRVNEELEEKVRLRTQALSRSLQRVRELKKRQDGDYFLTSQLIRPLGSNNARSKNVRVNILTRQKKRFSFRGYRGEIGGDLCVTENINLQGQSYTIFLNGDAMGKSLQGAGGALVLGSVFESLVERTRESGGDLSVRTPEDWLENAYRELHRVFETFEGGMLISLALGLLKEANGMLYMLNAEHPCGVLYRNSAAAFLEDRSGVSKLGTLHPDTNISVFKMQLEPGDTLIVGSDGRDDVLMQPNESGERLMLDDEAAFLRHVESGRGILKKIFRQIRRSGGLIDDISLISVEYIGADK